MISTATETIQAHFFKGIQFNSDEQASRKLDDLFKSLNEIPLKDQSSFFMPMGSHVTFMPTGDLDPLLSAMIIKVHEVAKSDPLLNPTIQGKYIAGIEFLRSWFFLKQHGFYKGDCLSQAIMNNLNSYVDLINPELRREPDWQQQKTFRSGILAALIKKDSEMIDRLAVDVDNVSQIFEEQFIVSIKQENLDIFYLLLSKNVNPKCRNQTALLYAIQTCHHEMIKKLLEFSWDNEDILRQSIQTAIRNEDSGSLHLLCEANLLSDLDRLEFIRIRIKGKNPVTFLFKRELGFNKFI